LKKKKKILLIEVEDFEPALLFKISRATRVEKFLN